MALDPVPLRSEWIDRQTGLLTREGARWLNAVKAALDTTTQQIGAVALALQGAAIATTAVPTRVLTAGLYRVSYTARITRPGTVSSSLTVTRSWTDGGVVCSLSGAALTGNLTSSVQTGTDLIRVDVNTVVNYATAYASVGATPMQYQLDITVEACPA